jgi:hypothetical protein
MNPILQNSKTRLVALDHITELRQVKIFGIKQYTRNEASRFELKKPGSQSYFNV